MRTRLPRCARCSATRQFVAVGECGLDFFRDYSPRDAQRRAFAAQLELAADVGKPVFLHQRDAHAEFVALLAPVRPRLVGGVAHCFTGGPEGARTPISSSTSTSASRVGSATSAAAAELRAAVPLIPLDRLLIETDAPYLLAARSRSEAAAVAATSRNFSRTCSSASPRCMKQPVEVVAQATTANAERLFGLARSV